MAMFCVGGLAVNRHSLVVDLVREHDYYLFGSNYRAHSPEVLLVHARLMQAAAAFMRSNAAVLTSTQWLNQV